MVSCSSNRSTTSSRTRSCTGGSATGSSTTATRGSVSPCTPVRSPSTTARPAVSRSCSSPTPTGTRASTSRRSTIRRRSACTWARVASIPSRCGGHRPSVTRQGLGIVGTLSKLVKSNDAASPLHDLDVRFVCGIGASQTGNFWRAFVDWRGDDAARLPGGDAAIDAYLTLIAPAPERVLDDAVFVHVLSEAEVVGTLNPRMMTAVEDRDSPTGTWLRDHRRPAHAALGADPGHGPRDSRSRSTPTNHTTCSFAPSPRTSSSRCATERRCRRARGSRVTHEPSTASHATNTGTRSAGSARRGSRSRRRSTCRVARAARRPARRSHSVTRRSCGSTAAATSCAPLDRAASTTSSSAGSSSQPTRRPCARPNETALSSPRALRRRP